MPETTRNIQEALQLPYDRGTWASLLAEVFPNVAIFQSPQRAEPLKPEFVKDLLQIGNVRLDDGKNLAIFEVSVSDKVDLARNRVALRELITGFIDQGAAHGVLCIFNSSDPQYRFTFVSKETVLNEEGHIVTSETNPKRFTYILGPGETRRTAAQRFAELAAKRDRARIADVVDAFSVERLNKEFFDRYKDHYEAFVQYLLESTDVPSRVLRVTAKKGTSAYDSSCKPVRDWVKKLLGRIVFIYFVQKKGWMGCKPISKTWKDGDPQFLRTLFDSAKDKDRFYSHALAPLFFEALNKPDRKSDIFDLTGTKVPYLNGGLFDETDLDSAGIELPANLFGSLFEFLGAYNFTIDENDPEEAQVGIDPEMLGHIFENLLEENRKKGAYYTPKSVVQFMCQQSLVLYLETHLGKRDEIEYLVRKKDAGSNSPKNWTRRNAARIEELLDDLTICDPAIGSGAFPIGILMEVFWIKLALDWTLNDPTTFADTKRRIIERTIHGVDIDPGAVEIARLRCWLALIVDEAAPRPLPNLEFNIFCADSLIEYVRGESVDMSRFKEDDTSRSMVEKLVAAKKAFFEADSRPAKRKALASVYEAIAALAHHEFSWLQTSEGFFNDSPRSEELDSASKEIRKIQKRIAALGKLSTGQQDAELSEIKRWFEDASKPTFLWSLHFGEVLARSGFDIILGNPPYISSITTSNKDQLRSRYSCYDPSGDIYVCFYQLGLQLLKTGGILAFITSNQYFRADYGLALRRHVTNCHTIRRVVDVCTADVFKAAAYPAIVFLQNGTNESQEVQIANWEERANPSLNNFEQVVWGSESIGRRLFIADRWLPISESKHSLLNRIVGEFSPLSTIPGMTMRRGVLTGCDEAFLLSDQERLSIISKDEASGAIIRPILQGRSLKQWRYEDENTFVLFSRRGIDINAFPGALAHLKPRRQRLEPGKEGGRKAGPYKWYEIQDSCAFADLFEKPKIAWGNLSVAPAFCLVPEGVFLKEPCPFIVGGGYWLLGILNSAVTHFFVHYTAAVRRGGFREYKPTYVGRIPIPTLSDGLKKQIAELAKKAVHSNTDVSEPLNEIVFEAYRLTASERKLMSEFLDLQARLAGI